MNSRSWPNIQSADVWLKHLEKTLLKKAAPIFDWKTENFYFCKGIWKLKNAQKKTLLSLLVIAESITIWTYRPYSYLQLKKRKLQLHQNHLKAEKYTKKELVALLVRAEHITVRTYPSCYYFQLVRVSACMLDSMGPSEAAWRVYLSMWSATDPLSPLKLRSSLLFFANHTKIIPFRQWNLNHLYYIYPILWKSLLASGKTCSFFKIDTFMHNIYPSIVVVTSNRYVA